MRKVLAVLERKGVGCRLDPIAPFVGNEAFTRLSPLPVMQKLAVIEDRIVRLPLAEQRTALTEMGVALTQTTLGDAAPRHGFRRA